MADCIPFLQYSKWYGLGGCAWNETNVAIALVASLVVLILIFKR